MSEWREVIIGDYIDLISGFAFKSDNFIDENLNGSLPVLKIKNVANGDANLESVVYHYYDESLSKYLINNGDMLIAMTGNHPQALTQVVGSVSKYKLNTKSLLNQRVGKIVVKKNANLNFIYYLFKYDVIQNILSNKSSGSANQANISKADILGLYVLLPPLPEQKAIASVLSSLDDKIDLLHRQNKTLEAMAETLFRQWFIEEADESWEVGKLGDFVSIVYGKNLPTNKLIDQGYPVYGGNGIIGYFNEYLYEEPQVLVSCRGAASGKINISTDNSFVTNNSLVLEINKKSCITFEYLKYYCLNYDFTPHVSGSAQPQITIEGLYDAEYLNPPQKLIHKFSENVREIINKCNFNNRQIQTLERLRDTLLPKLMSGEVRVKID